MRTSSVFKSRWMALLWCAGILWVAYDFAAPATEATNDANGNDVQITDATGAPVSPEEAKKLEQALKDL